MKTRTVFKTHDDGVVRCTGGSIENFAKDLCEFIIPLLDYKIDVEINRMIRTICIYDNADTIREKFKNEMMWV